MIQKVFYSTFFWLSFLFLKEANAKFDKIRCEALIITSEICHKAIVNYSSNINKAIAYYEDSIKDIEFLKKDTLNYSASMLTIEKTKEIEFNLAKDTLKRKFDIVALGSQGYRTEKCEKIEFRKIINQCYVDYYKIIPNIESKSNVDRGYTKPSGSTVN